MGTCCHAVAVADRERDRADALDLVVELVEGLEARWSRFRADSELSRVNAAAGSPVATSEETLALVLLARSATARTGGRYDPCVLGALCRAGYDEDFATVAATPGPRGERRQPGEQRPTAADVVVDTDAGTVQVPAGAGLDLGGIGKGFAADLATQAAMSTGITGITVNLGGDLRVGGAGPEGAWGVAVDDPARPGRVLATLALGSGAVVTSTTAMRRWRGPDGPAHHIIDPATGRPSASDVVTATVVAACAVDAEPLATAAVVGGRAWAESAVVGAGVAGLLVGADGMVVRVGDIEAFER
jgi:thiamine biosynthesis lipoprotein